MSIQIKGLNSLINKLNKLSNIETKKIIEEIAVDAETTIREKAKTFSDTAYLYIAKGEARTYGLSTYVDVGLKNDYQPFELWKGLWFHQWGYFNYGLNFSGQEYLNMHQLWFNEAVDSVKQESLNKIKVRLKNEIKEALGK